MCLALCTLSDANIQKVLADPPLIWKVIAPDDPEAYENAVKKPSGFIATLFGRKKASTASITPFHLSDGEVIATDLDKAWHGIHYMLTRSAWEGDEPLNFLVMGGSHIGNIDVGYGPARVFTSAQVHAIAAALRTIDSAFLKSRFNPSKMMALNIYPEIWDSDPAKDDSFAYCEEYFGTLKSFVEKAAQRNVGMVISIT